ncbi:McrB family protein [Helicobacter zhangjianzhongii]|uniref:McrB family protein n=1 Tax=Helicobacter zhangjianzhongii TaxID=2974574 RepID=UPI0025542D87|nr:MULTISPECIES: AAA family ATPase [unclassified Helicobacter]
MDKRYWIFASSDISRKNIAELEQHKRTTWDKANGMKIGDIAFLYLTAPEKCITAQTQIVSIDDNKIEIELVKFFDPRIPLADMNSIGMAHPQGGVGSIKEKRYVDFILNYPESLKTAQQEASKHFLQGKRVWLYKPGEQGSKWELMLERGLMGIGWSKLGDLRQYKVAEEIESKLNELYPTKNGSLRLNDKPANWDMCNTINKGDIIIAVTGLNTLLGYGKVVSDYFYDESIDDEFASFRKVDWTCSGKWDIDFDRDIFKDDNVKQLPIKTLTDITKQGYPQKLLAIMWGNILDTKPTYDIPLNQILYGPPGTGKTYHTIDKALEILCERGEIDSIPQERDEKKALFNECMEQGQIGFVTFHQSYGYEDFVEGIRPRLSGENDESQISEKMEYEIKDGIFKSMCKKANENYEKSQKDSSEVKREIELDDLLEQYAVYVEDELKEGKEPKFEPKEWTTKMKIQGVHRLQNGDFSSIMIGTNKDSGVMQRLTQKVIKRDYEKFKSGEIKDWNDIKPSYESKSHRHGNAGYYFTLYESIAEFEKTHYQVSTIPTLESTFDNRLKPYILIIDEINRGNISKILGELITLLEPSKRKGNDEALEVKLPYSQESFSVPNNLYIIGTMNTADRSIALLDTALRRRFEFIEMLPDSSKLSTNCDGINLQKLLEAMNNRIEFLLDRERSIGHAFFIGATNLNDLQAVFKHKILPLLQEYFYDDYAKINVVLNDNGMLKSQTMNDVKISLSDDFVDREKQIWKITDSSEWSMDTFQTMYKDTQSS